MPIERAASSIFFWVRRATIASSFLRSVFRAVTLHLQSPAISGRHRRPIAIGCRLRLLAFPTGMIHVVTAVITAQGEFTMTTPNTESGGPPKHGRPDKHAFLY
jgi:hypothetical protein